MHKVFYFILVDTNVVGRKHCREDETLNFKSIPDPFGSFLNNIPKGGLVNVIHQESELEKGRFFGSIRCAKYIICKELMVQLQTFTTSDKIFI